LRNKWQTRAATPGHEQHQNSDHVPCSHQTRMHGARKALSQRYSRLLPPVTPAPGLHQHVPTHGQYSAWSGERSGVDSGESAQAWCWRSNTWHHPGGGPGLYRRRARRRLPASAWTQSSMTEKTAAGAGPAATFWLTWASRAAQLWIT
jgi:hypothetical protein